MPVINSQGEVDLSGLKCLIVDDDRHGRALVRQVLAQAGLHSVLESQPGPDLGDVLRQNFVDVVFITQEPAKPNALEIVKYIRSKSSDLPNPKVPIIIVSAASDAQTVLAAREASISDFVVKPLSAATVLKRLDAMINKINNPKN